MKPTSNNSNCLIFTAMALMAVIVSFFSVSSIMQNGPDGPVDINSLVIFQFDTYCPVDSQAKLKTINSELAKQGISPLDFNYNSNKQVYVVNIQARPSNSSDQSSTAGLYYCGLAKKWWENSCNSAAFICSSPGPMFYFPVKQQATIIWINSIQTQGLNWAEDNCYDTEGSSDHDCTVTKKPQPWKKCTYFEPTNYQYNNAEYQRVKRESVPISPHIHGLQIRPAYDGNPLSWFTAHGETGSGFQSLHLPQYFSFFKQEDSFKGMRDIKKDLSQKIKVIKVDNNQPPGLLFYHDHAMKSTLYNVQNGLGGLYVIYDPVLEATLPKGQFLKYIVLARQGDSRPVIVSKDGLMQDDFNQQTFQRSATYRFRMLNMAFDNAYDSVTFAAYYSEQEIDGKTVYKEIDPSSSQYPLDQNKHIIPFSVIGTDTTMFHKTVNNVNHVNFGPAQRVDLLIRFDKVIPSNINNVYIVCFDNNQGTSVIKHRFRVNQVPKILPKPKEELLSSQQSNNIVVISAQPKLKDEQIKHPQDYQTLSIPFTNLSKVSDAEIAVKRHRPLFSLPRDGRFMIGAHYMFEMGKTDRPKIGTIQDFYLINNLWQAHPMHIHLINHQVVQAYTLKQLPQNPECTLYFLDYFRLSNLPQFKGLNNVDLCTYLWGMEDEKVLQLFENLKDYMPEDKIEVTANGRVNGLDVMALSNGDASYKVGNCALDDTHKYICGNSYDEVLEHERRWKDTSMVHPYTVFVMRVRWASTSYDPAVRAYPYFNIPEEQLAEFPGFVYHCHILPHEDNQMMRSISLQYSSFYVQNLLQNDNNKGKCLKKTWQEKMLCINEALGCRKAK